MSEPTDIEKKSLEAHVELCAERYRNLDERFADLGKNISKVEEIVEEVHTLLNQMSEKRNSQLINWGIGIIGTLVAVIGYLLSQHVVFK